jgi:hypothetical protein
VSIFLGCPQIPTRNHITDARVVPLRYLKHVQVNMRRPKIRYAVPDLMLGHGTGFLLRLLLHNWLVSYQFFFRTHRPQSGPRCPGEVSEGASVFNYLIICDVVQLNNHLLLVDLLARALPLTLD